MYLFFSVQNGLFSTIGAPACSGAECSDTADGCSAGAQSVADAAATYVCALCPAGTTSTAGGACENCAAGALTGNVGVGATTCGTDCAAGTYAGAGYSNCIPCDAGK